MREHEHEHGQELTGVNSIDIKSEKNDVILTAKVIIQKVYV